MKIPHKMGLQKGRQQAQRTDGGGCGGKMARHTKKNPLVTGILLPLS